MSQPGPASNGAEGPSSTDDDLHIDILSLNGSHVSRLDEIVQQQGSHQQLQAVECARQEQMQRIPQLLSWSHSLLMRASQEGAEAAEAKQQLEHAVLLLGPTAEATMLKIMAFIQTASPTQHKASMFQAVSLIVWICKNKSLNYSVDCCKVVRFFGACAAAEGLTEIYQAGLTLLVLSGDDDILQEVLAHTSGFMGLLHLQIMAVANSCSLLEQRKAHCDAITVLLAKVQEEIAPETYVQLLSASASVIKDAKLAVNEDSDETRRQALQLLSAALRRAQGGESHADEWRMLQLQAQDNQATGGVCEDSILDMMDDVADGCGDLALAALLAYLQRYVPAAAEPEHPVMLHLLHSRFIPSLCGLLERGAAASPLDCLRVLQRLVTANDQAGVDQLLDSRGFSKLLQLAQGRVDDGEAPTLLLMDLEVQQLLATICTSAVNAWPQDPSQDAEDALDHLLRLLLGLLAVSSDATVVLQTMHNLSNLLEAGLTDPMGLDMHTQAISGPLEGRCCRALVHILQRSKGWKEGCFTADGPAVLQAAASLVRQLFKQSSIHSSAAEWGLVQAMMSRELLRACPDLLQPLILLARESWALHYHLHSPALHQALQDWMTDLSLWYEGGEGSKCGGGSSDNVPAWWRAWLASLELLYLLLTGPESRHAVPLAADTYSRSRQGPGSSDWIDILLIHMSGKHQGHTACVLERLLPEVFDLWWSEALTRPHALAPVQLAGAVREACNAAVHQAQVAAAGQAVGSGGEWDRLLSLTRCVRRVMTLQGVERRRLEWLGDTVHEVLSLLHCFSTWPQAGGQQEGGERQRGEELEEDAEELPAWLAGMACSSVVHEIIECCLAIIQVVLSASGPTPSKPEDPLLIRLFEHPSAASLMADLLQLAGTKSPGVPARVRQLAADVCTSSVQCYAPWTAGGLEAQPVEVWSLPVRTLRAIQSNRAMLQYMLQLLEQEARQAASGSLPSELSSSCALAALAALHCLLHLSPCPGSSVELNVPAAPAWEPGVPGSCRINMQLAASLLTGGVVQALLCLVKARVWQLRAREAALQLLLEFTQQLRTQIFTLDGGKLKWMDGVDGRQVHLLLELTVLFPTQPLEREEPDVQVLQMLACKVLRSLVKKVDMEYEALNEQAQRSMFSLRLTAALALLCPDDAGVAEEAWLGSTFERLSGAQRKAVLAHEARLTLRECGFQFEVPQQDPTGPEQGEESVFEGFATGTCMPSRERQLKQ